MGESYPEYPLDSHYQCTAERMSDIRLAIVGKDPYPRGACSIPFIKDTWPGLNGTSAGYYLFRSLLGCSFMNLYESPREAAFALLVRGVVLLNVSYYCLGREDPAQRRHREYVLGSHRTNRPILVKCKSILLVHSALKMAGWLPDQPYRECIVVPHPTLQSKNSRGRHRNQEWDRWWGCGSLDAWLNGH